MGWYEKKLGQEVAMIHCSTRESQIEGVDKEEASTDQPRLLSLSLSNMEQTKRQRHSRPFPQGEIAEGRMDLKKG